MQYFVLTNLKKTPLPLRDQTPNYTRKHVSRGLFGNAKPSNVPIRKYIHTFNRRLNRLDLPLESSPMFSRGIALSCTCMYRLKNIYTCTVYRFCKLAHTKHIVSKKKCDDKFDIIFLDCVKYESPLSSFS